MNKSEIFKAAHAMAKKVHKAGDCYRVTFGAALRIVRSEPTKITLRQVRIGRVVTRTFDSKPGLVAYCMSSLSPDLLTYEACVAYCAKARYSLEVA